MSAERPVQLFCEGGLPSTETDLVFVISSAFIMYEVRVPLGSLQPNDQKTAAAAGNKSSGSSGGDDSSSLRIVKRASFRRLYNGKPDNPAPTDSQSLKKPGAGDPATTVPRNRFLFNRYIYPMALSTPEVVCVNTRAVLKTTADSLPYEFRTLIWTIDYHHSSTGTGTGTGGLGWTINTYHPPPSEKNYYDPNASPFNGRVVLDYADRSSIHLSVGAQGRSHIFSRLKKSEQKSLHHYSSGNSKSNAVAGGGGVRFDLSALRYLCRLQVVTGDEFGPFPLSAPPDHMQSGDSSAFETGSVSDRMTAVAAAMSPHLVKELIALVTAYSNKWAERRTYVLCRLLADEPPAKSVMSSLVSLVSSKQPTPKQTQLRTLQWYKSLPLPFAIPLSPQIEPVASAVITGSDVSGSGGGGGGGGGGGAEYRFDPRYRATSPGSNSSCIIDPASQSVLRRYDLVVSDTAVGGWSAPDARFIVFRCPTRRGMTYGIAGLNSAGNWVTGSILSINKQSVIPCMWYSADSKYLYFYCGDSLYELSVETWIDLASQIPPVSADRQISRSCRLVRDRWDRNHPLAHLTDIGQRAEMHHGCKPLTFVVPLPHNQSPLKSSSSSAVTARPAGLYAEAWPCIITACFPRRIRSGWRQMNVRNHYLIVNRVLAAKRASGQPHGVKCQGRRALATARRYAGGKKPDESTKSKAPARNTKYTPPDPKKAARLAEQTARHRAFNSDLDLKSVRCSTAAIAGFHVPEDVSVRLVAAVQSVVGVRAARIKHVRCVAASTDLGVYLCLEPALKVWCVVRTSDNRVWSVDGGEQLASDWRNFAAWTAEPRAN